VHEACPEQLHWTIVFTYFETSAEVDELLLQIVAEQAVACPHRVIHPESVNDRFACALGGRE